LTCWVLLAAVAPSAWLAWTWRTAPHAGIYHDDGLYLVTARALAEGRGYRIESLPGEPFQTKFPPVFPLLLSLAWRWGGSLERTLPVAMAFVWAMLPAMVGLSWLLYRDEGVSRRARLGLCLFLALNPVSVMFATLLMSELTFTALLIAALVCAGRGRAALAGALGGAAFLTRSAGLPLLVTLPAVYAWKRDWRKACAAFATMLPAVAGWQIWCAVARVPGADPLTQYYTNYFGFYVLDVTPGELPSLAWVNVGSVVKGIGELLIFDESQTMISLTLARLLTVAAVAGAIRLARNGRFVHYSAFAVLYIVQFLAWNYPPNSRFLLPLLPLLAVAILEELGKFTALLKASFRKPGIADKAAAVLAGLLLALTAGYAVERAHYGIFRFLPDAYTIQSGALRVRLPAIDWIRKNTPPTARIVSNGDPMVFLRTGRQGHKFPVPPGLYRRGDRAEFSRFYRRLPEIARAWGFEYVLLAPDDYMMDMPAMTVPSLRAVLEDRARFEPAFRKGDVAVYRARIQ